MSVDRLSLPFDTEQLDLPSGAVVVLRADPQRDYSELQSGNVTCVQSFLPHFERLGDLGFSTASALPDHADMAVVHLTRSRDENRANIARAYDILTDGGVLVVDGAKTDGVDSMLKSLKKHVEIDGVISKSHGKVLWFSKTSPVTEFDLWTKGLTPQQNSEGFWTHAGMFSHDKVDAGSKMLAAEIAGKLKGSGADLGSGWGWLGQQALAGNPAITSLDMIEAENLAVTCAGQNVTDPRARLLWADATIPAKGAAYDFIIMNPPFHQTRNADPDLGRSFIRAAAKMLRPNGKLYMVANRQLAYEKTLAENFRSVDQTGLTGGFKTIMARKPKK